MSEVLLRVDGLRKRFGEVVAVDGVDFELRRGEILGLLGPNGAGKTTTLQLVCGTLRPDAGRIEIEGRALVPGDRSLRARLGVAPQQIVIWDSLTCLEQLEFVGRSYDLPPARARARARDLLVALGLEDKAQRLGRTLSGGMQRRLNIALGLVHEPALLLLDEPQAGLDPQSRVRVREVVRELRGHSSVLMTTHDMDEADRLADRVCIVDRGRVLVIDQVDRLKHRGGDGELFEIRVGSDDPGRLAQAAAACGARANPGPGALLLPVQVGATGLADALRALESRGLPVQGVHTRGVTLEDVFIQLTGRRLRE